MTDPMGPSSASAEPRRARELTREESMLLLAEAQYGRVVFTLRALPTIRPVNHLIDDGDIIIRTDHGAALTAATGDGVVVAYEADRIDPVRRLGWSVIVTGLSTAVAEPAATRFRRRLRPWVAGERDAVIRIHPAFVTGIRLVRE